MPSTSCRELFESEGWDESRSEVEAKRFAGRAIRQQKVSLCRGPHWRDTIVSRPQSCRKREAGHGASSNSEIQALFKTASNRASTLRNADSTPLEYFAEIGMSKRSRGWGLEEEEAEHQESA